jgi:outer membrane protein OmpA-like peptidoglycan-associated protein
MNITIMQKTLFLFLIIVSLSAQSQTIWADKVLGVSSEHSGVGQQHKASQLVGKPSKLPQAESGGTAWRPAQENNGEEWLKVGFSSPMAIRQVAVAQNFGGGCITKIFAYDPKGTEYLIFERKTPDKTPLFRLTLNKPTAYTVATIKVVLNTKLVKGWNEIDAVGLSESPQPIQAQINTVAGVPKELKAENLGANVNSKANEAAPVISPDGKTIYFTRLDHPDNISPKNDYDVWFSEQKEGKWQPAQNIGRPVNNASVNSICYISPDDRTALLMNVFAADGSIIGGGVSTSRKNQTGWTAPTAVSIANYQNQKPVSAFYIGPNGKVMVLSLEDETTVGSSDLYVSFLQENGQWSKPKNMGAGINTADAEYTPFLATDNQTLYFTTNGRSGYGEADIFLSRRLDDTWTNWSEPQNLGPSFNTEQQEAHFTIPASGSYAYFCTALDDSFGDGDIYRVALPEPLKPNLTVILTGTVLDQKTNKPVQAEVIVEDLDQKQTPQQLDYDPAVGDFKIVLDTKKQYGITAQKKGYQASSTILDLTKEQKYQEIKQIILLAPIEVGQRVVLNTILFEQSKSNLLPSSLPELDRIVVIMTDNPTMEILLEGHTDNRGDFDANVLLSKERVEEVKKYLGSKTIAPNRIQTKGYGPARPIANNEMEATRKLNRRVEFTILKK